MNEVIFDICSNFSEIIPAMTPAAPIIIELSNKAKKK